MCRYSKAPESCCGGNGQDTGIRYGSFQQEVQIFTHRMRPAVDITGCNPVESALGIRLHLLLCLGLVLEVLPFVAQDPIPDAVMPFSLPLDEFAFAPFVVEA